MRQATARAPPRVRWWRDEAQDEDGQAPDRGWRLLAGLLQLPSVDAFDDYWLTKPYLRQMSAEERAASQADPRHWVHMLSLGQVRGLLRRTAPRPVRWLHDVDATRYVGGRRMALAEGDGEVDVPAAWKAFRKDGYSLRMVHPQQWHQPTYELCAHLQEFFGFPVGCSSYLTPAGSQGFPPHYDDVEIFVLQLEGRKRWRLYHRPDADTAPSPRVTTEFSQASLGEPFRELELLAGDVMYFPRGVVHQAVTDPREHSLHLTFSTYQRHTWHDLLALALADDSEAAAELVELAQQHGWLHTDLPRDILDTPSAGHPKAAWDRLGSALIPPRIPMRLTAKLQRDGVLGWGVDQLFKAFLANSLPPPAGRERSRDGPLTRSCTVRMQAKWCARLVDEGRSSTSASQWASGDVDPGAGESEGPQLVLYTNCANGRSLEGEGSPAFEVLPGLGSSVLALLAAGTGGVRVDTLPAFEASGGGEGEDDELQLDLLELIETLREHGVVLRT